MYQTQFFTCTFMVPVYSSKILMLILAVHRYHVIAYLINISNADAVISRQ